jgi:cardiolipin synthase
MTITPHLRWKSGNAISLLENGVQLFPALCEAFDRATISIHLETYIFQLDEAGTKILHHLKQAALRGVKVRVVLDGFGCAEQDQEIQAQLMAAGALCRIYRPEPKSFGLNGFDMMRLRRLHRKIVIVDGKTAFLGGINFEDDYAENDPTIRSTDPRFDFAVQVTGPVVQDAIHALDILWLRLVHTQRECDRPHLRPLHKLRYLRHLHLRHPRHHTTTVVPAGSITAALVLRDNLRFRKSIETAYLSAISAAQHDIVIANAYFLPGHRLRKALIAAANRGVRVRLLLQGKIEYQLQYHATRWIYDQFLKHGIEIYEYIPSFLHAKVAVMDNWATVGSSNLDPFSLLLAREANLMIQNAGFAGQLRQSLEFAMTRGSRVIEHTLYSRRGWLTQAGDAMAYFLLRIGVALSGKNEDY